MNKMVSVERLFALGDYQNIKFINVITDIPEEILMNPKAIETLWYLQLIEIEEARNKYDLLTRSIIDTSHEKVAVMLEEERMRTYQEFIKQIDKKED